MGRATANKAIATGAGIAFVLGLAGCAPSVGVGPAVPQPAGAPSAVSHATPTGTSSPVWALCAEFPPQMGDHPGDGEGWWNATPADSSGNVIDDPSKWPDPRMRAHPRVALVDTDSARVISTYDRISCGPIPDFHPVADPSWPPHSVVVVDADTGKVIPDA